VNVLGTGRDLFGGEAPERVTHELEVSIEVCRARRLGEGRQQLGIPAGGEERGDLGVPAGLDAPLGLPAGGPRHQIGDDVSSEGRRETGLGRAVSRVPQCCLGSVDAGCGVGEVVSEDLVVVQPAAAFGDVGEAHGCRSDDGRRDSHGLGGSGGQVAWLHNWLDLGGRGGLRHGRQGTGGTAGG